MAPTRVWLRIQKAAEQRRDGLPTAKRSTLQIALRKITERIAKFSQPDYDTIRAGSREERVQYESFVSYFRYACEETIAAFADKREWQASCDYDLKPHLPFLCEKNAAQPAYLATYGAETQKWIAASLKTASVTPPDCKLGKT